MLDTMCFSPRALTCVNKLVHDIVQSPRWCADAHSVQPDLHSAVWRFAADIANVLQVKSVVAMDQRSWRERMSSLVDQWVGWAPVLPALDAA